MTSSATIAIPVINAGARFVETLGALGSQRWTGSLQIIICDSGSRDGSPAVARRYGAEVITIPGEHFSHGRTRNLLMEHARGDHVAFLTQDAVPANSDWLQNLVRGFDLAHDVGLVFGPYLPRPEASPMVARELAGWFSSFGPACVPRIDRLPEAQRDLPGQAFHGHLGYFSDVNGCISRDAWRQVRFRDVPYAEDLFLAQDMLRAGFAKVFMPEASVVHSHDYSLPDWLRRSFDEARAMRHIYGWSAPLAPGPVLRDIVGQVRADQSWRRASGTPTAPLVAGALASIAWHGVRAAGSGLGARSERLPRAVSRRLSLERRSG